MNRTLPHLLEHFVTTAGKSVFVKSNDTVWNPQKLHSNVLKWAAFLKKLDVRPGDRVVLYLRKSLEEVGLTFAIASVGAIFVNLHPSNRFQQVQHVLQDCGAELLISSKELLRRFGPALAELGLRQLVVIDKSAGLKTRCQVHELSNAETLTASEECVTPRIIDDDFATILYTSGSTGKPKGIIQTHGNLIEGAEIVTHYVQNTPQDILLSLLPFSFDYGLNQLLSAMFAQCSLVLQDYLFPIDVVETLERDGITGLAGVPTIWHELLNVLENAEATSLPQLRYITNTGGKLYPKTVRRLREQLPNADIYLMYGLTEAFRSTYLAPNEVDKRPDSIGKAIPNVTVHVINEEGRECKPNEVGELVHRGALIAKGYWNDLEMSARVFRPNPLLPELTQHAETVVYSGDLVRRDKEGYLYFVARKDKMLKCSGHRISPDQITDVIMKMKGVLQAAVIGIEDEYLGQQIAAVLQLAPGVQATEGECKTFVNRFLPSHMVPSIFRFVDQLPKTSNGKPDQDMLQRLVIPNENP